MSENSNFRIAFSTMRQVHPGSFEFNITRPQALGNTVGKINLRGDQAITAAHKRAVLGLAREDTFVVGSIVTGGSVSISHGWVEKSGSDKVVGEGTTKFDLEVPPDNLSFQRVPLLLALYNALVFDKARDAVEISEGTETFAGTFGGKPGTVLALTILRELADIADAQITIAGKRVANLQQMISGT